MEHMLMEDKEFMPRMNEAREVFGRTIDSKIM
jgi:hypothetical protein